jgi:hypothetical protein
MVECIDIGSYIITILVMTHGQVIKLNISPEKQKIFENVTLLSLAGDFVETGLGPNPIRNDHLKFLNDRFQQNLNNTTRSVMQTAADRIRPVYMNYMEAFFGKSAENSCKIFDNVQFDKAYGMGVDGILDSIIQFISPDVFGIYLISVHEKIDNTTLKLIYPKDENQQNLDLLQRGDLIKFATFFKTDGNTIINNLIQESTPWRPIANISPTDEKHIQEIQKWKVTTSLSGNILQIRLSYLISIIKDIVGHDKCKMNIIDYSCSPISHFVSRAELPYAQYTKEGDIETPSDTPPFGGKNARKKRRTYRRFAKKRYTKKRHRKNKSSNNPIQKKAT